MYKTWRLLVGQPIDLTLDNEIRFLTLSSLSWSRFKEHLCFLVEPTLKMGLWDTYALGPCWCLKISIYTPNKKKERKDMKAMSLSYNYVTSKLHPNYLIRQTKDKQQISSQKRYKQYVKCDLISMTFCVSIQPCLFWTCFFLLLQPTNQGSWRIDASWPIDRLHYDPHMFLLYITLALFGHIGPKMCRKKWYCDLYLVSYLPTCHVFGLTIVEQVGWLHVNKLFLH